MSVSTLRSPGSDALPRNFSGQERYPNPYFTVGQTYEPISVKHAFRICAELYNKNELVRPAVNKMARYPVTTLSFSAPDKKTEEQYEKIYKEDLDIESFLIDCNINYYGYGNAYVSVHFPISKILTCKGCGKGVSADQANYDWRNFDFVLHCANCRFVGVASVKDFHIRSYKGIRLINWDPQSIEIYYNDLTGAAVYSLTVPGTTASHIRSGNPIYLNSTPQMYIDAVRKGLKIVLNHSNFFHLRAPNIAGKDIGYGSPLAMPVLQSLYLLQVLRRGQETIAHELMVPLRAIYPESTQGGVDILKTIDVTSWQTAVRSEFARHRQDPAYIPILPVPIGVQTIGGQGKSLLLVQEIRQLSEQIIAGMEVPMELVFGGSSYSASSVSLRMLENQVLGNQNRLRKLVNFITGVISSYLGLQKVTASFASIRGADDIQLKNLMLQLQSANQISRRTLLGKIGIDPDEETRQIEKETDERLQLETKQSLENAKNQGKAMVISAKYQAEAQIEANKVTMRQQPGQSVQPGQPEHPPAGDGQDEGQLQPLDDKQIAQVVKKLGALKDAQRQRAMKDIQANVLPQDFQKINKGLSGRKGQEAMKPLPEQKPPRRAPDKASI